MRIPCRSSTHKFHVHDNSSPPPLHYQRIRIPQALQSIHPRNSSYRQPRHLFQSTILITIAACIRSQRVEISVPSGYNTASKPFTLLAEMPLARPAHNAVPLSPPQSSTTDTLLALTSLKTAVETHSLHDHSMGSCASEKPVERLLPDTPQSRLQLSELPVEIHEAILDHLFGVRASTSSSMANGSQATRGWSNVLRHPRRKQLSNLALVSPLWRRLVQERLYRHSKSHSYDNFSITYP